jgi:hypothetical protein
MFRPSSDQKRQVARLNKDELFRFIAEKGQGCRLDRDEVIPLYCRKRTRMQTRATLRFVSTMGEIWICSSKTFCGFCPHHAENIRFAGWTGTNYVDSIAEKDKGAGLRHITICHHSGKI